MKASEALVQARKLISERDNWTQIEYARDSKGKRVFDLSEATCFCSLGALLFTQGRALSYCEKNLIGFKYLKQSCENMGYYLISDMNDSLSHSSVLEVFDSAINLAILSGD